MILGSEIVKALLLSLLLLIGTVVLTVREWAVLLLDVIVLALLMPRVPGLLHEAVNQTYLYAMSRRWAIWFSTGLLWLDSVLVLALRTKDDYRGLDWTDAVAYSTSAARSSADGGVFALMSRIDAGVDGLAIWASYQLLHGAGELAEGVAAAMVLIGVLSIWFALAWAYSRAIVGATARPLAVWRPRRYHNAGNAYEPWWI